MTSQNPRAHRRRRTAALGTSLALAGGLALLVVEPALADTPADTSADQSAPEALAVAQAPAEPPVEEAAVEPPVEEIAAAVVGDETPAPEDEPGPLAAPADVAEGPLDEDAPDDLDNGDPEPDPEPQPLGPDDVEALNLKPIAAPDAYFVGDDEPLVVAAPGILANDTDPEGAVLLAGDVQPPIGGILPGESLVVAGDGSFTYTPPTGYTGLRTWTYVAWDGELTSTPGTISFTILEDDKVPPPVNDPAVGVDDFYTVDHNATLTVDAAAGVLANDTDADGDALEVAYLFQPADGEVEMNADGSFTYTPPLGFSGLVQFPYGPTDGVAGGFGAIVTIEVALPELAIPEDEPAEPADPAAEPAGEIETLAETGPGGFAPLAGLAAALVAAGAATRFLTRRRA